MILGFNKRFEAPILAEEKGHTIREDSHDRWHAGRNIQMATGVRTKHYNCFKQAVCVSTQTIKIKWFESKRPIEAWEGHVYNPKEYLYAQVVVDGKQLSHCELAAIAINDGFESKEAFFQWFCKDFTGKIIHWTNLKY